MGRKKLTTDIFIKKSKAIHNNKYSYEKSNYVGGKDKITITCLIHGDFEQLLCELMNPKTQQLLKDNKN